MPKQIPDISQDIETKKDAELYAKSVMKRLNVADVEQAIVRAYLSGAKGGFCCGYHISDMEAEKVYGKVIEYYKKQLKEEKRCQ